MSLRVPRFLIPINSEAPHFWVTFWLSPTLEFSSPGFSFAVTALSTDCSFFLSSSSITNFPSKDLFSSKERFSLDFSKFPIAHSFLRRTCYCFLDRVILVCLKRKWTYRCPDSGFLVSLIILVACLERKWVYWYPDLGFFGLSACFCVIIMFMSSIHAFRYRCDGAIGATFPLSSAKRSVAKSV